MSTCSNRGPMTVEQLRERLAAEEEPSGTRRLWPTGWLWLVAASTIALGAASFVFRGFA